MIQSYRIKHRPVIHVLLKHPCVVLGPPPSSGRTRKPLVLLYCQQHESRGGPRGSPASHTSGGGGHCQILPYYIYMCIISRESSSAMEVTSSTSRWTSPSFFSLPRSRTDVPLLVVRKRGQESGEHKDSLVRRACVDTLPADTVKKQLPQRHVPHVSCSLRSGQPRCHSTIANAASYVSSTKGGVPVGILGILYISGVVLDIAFFP